MKKVIIATGTLGGGGAERVFLNIANEMSERDVQVRILVTGSRKAESYPVSDKIIIDKIQSNKQNKIFKIIDKFVQFRKYFKMHEDSTVISFFPDVSAYCVLASFGIKNKNIVSERNNPYIIPRKNLMKKIRNVAFDYADVCVFQTEDAKKYFSKKVQNKGYIIKNPINIEQLPEVLDFERREKVILAVGRIVPQKNFMMLVQAWEMIEKMYPDYVLYIYGDKTYRDGVFTEELQEYIRQRKLDTRVVLMGFSNDIYSIMNRAAIYVSSSDFEGMSNTMIEAMAMGAPTIATDCPIGGARMVIQDGVNGILTAVGDKDDMANAIKGLLDDREKCIKMSREAQEVRKTMSVQNICDEWVKLL